MQDLDQLAQTYHAIIVDDISVFQRKVRILQSMWREEKGYEAGMFRNRLLGNLLPMPWAERTLSNFLSETIRKVLQREMYSSSTMSKTYTIPSIYNNLLSSQSLCFNLFAELKEDISLATKVFKKLNPYRIEKVVRIEFEHSPGRRDPIYTGDNSAFNVYVEYLNGNKEKGFIGIEVKYHENLQFAPAEVKKRYLEITSEMRCFRKDSIDALKQPPLEQIWRGHLLAGSLLNSPKDDFKDGFFVILYPKDNIHCKEAVKQYRHCLTDNTTFQDWTLERLTNIMKQHTDKKWIDDVIDRYLNFGKIEK
jgi:hypothetical protein